MYSFASKSEQMATQKKCSECGQWTTWHHKLTDTCEHCGQLLDKRTINDLQYFENQQKLNDENSFSVPKPGDNFLMLALRRTVWIANVIYMATVSFFLWLFTTLAG